MAAKKSSAELKEEGASLGEQITLARKRAVNFALQIGKDGLVLETDIKKNPEVLWRNCKKNGGGPKGAMGTMTVRGKVIELNCLDDSAPNQLPKLAKKWLSERGLAYKVVMMTPSGEIGDEDAGAEEAEAGEEANTGATEDGGAESQAAAAVSTLSAQVRETFEAMSGQIEEATRSVHPGAAQKTAKLSETVASLLEDNPEKASGMMKLLEKTVNDAIAFGVAPAQAAAEAATPESASGATAGAQESGDASSETAAPESSQAAAAKQRRITGLREMRQRVKDLMAEFA